MTFKSWDIFERNCRNSTWQFLDIPGRLQLMCLCPGEFPSLKRLVACWCMLHLWKILSHMHFEPRNHHWRRRSRVGKSPAVSTDLPLRKHILHCPSALAGQPHSHHFRRRKVFPGQENVEETSEGKTAPPPARGGAELSPHKPPRNRHFAPEI